MTGRPAPTRCRDEEPRERIRAFDLARIVFVPPRPVIW
jgi:hypothetical protein